jgi:hypothetical protein
MSSLPPPATLRCGHPAALRCGHPAALRCGHPAALRCGHPAALRCGHPAALRCGHPAALRCGRPAALRCGHPAAFRCGHPAALRCGQQNATARLRAEKRTVLSCPRAGFTKGALSILHVHVNNPHDVDQQSPVPSRCGRRAALRCGRPALWWPVCGWFRPPATLRSYSCGAPWPCKEGPPGAQMREPRQGSSSAVLRLAARRFGAASGRRRT